MRKCNVCKKEMYEGFYAYDNYYCDCECLDKDYSKEEWNELHNENPDEFYWTIFEE